MGMEPELVVVEGRSKSGGFQNDIEYNSKRLSARKRVLGSRLVAHSRASRYLRLTGYGEMLIPAISGDDYDLADTRIFHTSGRQEAGD